MTTVAQETLFQRIVVRMARILFKLRGNHSEMHITEAELAGMLAGAARLGVVGCSVPVGECSADERDVMMPKSLNIQFDESVERVLAEDQETGK
jgi:hypothetical protein